MNKSERGTKAMNAYYHGLPGLTTAQAAKLLGISATLMGKFARAGLIGTNVGRERKVYRYTPEEIERFKTERLPYCVPSTPDPMERDTPHGAP